MAEDGVLTIPSASRALGVLGNDFDVDDAQGTLMVAELVTGPAHGTLTLAANGPLFEPEVAFAIVAPVMALTSLIP